MALRSDPWLPPRAGPPGDACLKYISGKWSSFASRPERLRAYKGMRTSEKVIQRVDYLIVGLTAIVGTKKQFLFFFFPVGGCK